MNKSLFFLIFVILLIGNFSVACVFAATVVEQEVYGVLAGGKALPDQEVAVENPLIADFGFGLNNKFSYIGDIEDIDVTCSKIAGPENLVVYAGGDGTCVVRWDEGISDNPTQDEKGKHYIDVKVENGNGDMFFYSFTIMVYSWLIRLDKKWNLISIPVNALDSNITEVLGDVLGDVEEVWGYENETWKVFYPEDIVGSTLATVVPGRGYWVKTKGSTLLVAGDLFEEVTIPNSVPLNDGWNLIGHYGLVENRPVFCSLLSLVDTNSGFPRWSALVGYESSNGQFLDMDLVGVMNPGKGYWIEMDGEDGYSPSLSC